MRNISGERQVEDVPLLYVQDTWKKPLILKAQTYVALLAVSLFYKCRKTWKYERF